MQNLILNTNISAPRYKNNFNSQTSRLRFNLTNNVHLRALGIVPCRSILHTITPTHTQTNTIYPRSVPTPIPLLLIFRYTFYPDTSNAFPRTVTTSSRFFLFQQSSIAPDETHHILPATFQCRRFPIPLTYLLASDLARFLMHGRCCAGGSGIDDEGNLRSARRMRSGPISRLTTALGSSLA
ncbi:hypothetical protein BJ165DRAFT_331663 [Panaeolus papilionaceus]|nr:hypothetical protein BJ165DRAFT_331663 [Panaeolus papilionaceus]